MRIYTRPVITALHCQKSISSKVLTPVLRDMAASPYYIMCQIIFKMSQNIVYVKYSAPNYQEVPLHPVTFCSMQAMIHST